MIYEVLVDRVESRRKCTILPLSERPDFRIKRFSRGRPLPPITADLLLHVDGAPLDALVRGGALPPVRTLGAIDCQWGRCAAILAFASGPLPPLVRIPLGFEGAYPRRNFAGEDPESGLASIEAIFIASAFLGVWDETLLSRYHFAKDFLDKNEAAFARYGLRPL